ncbi:MAG: dihydropteroate synthase [Flavobacterium sp.]
MLHTKNTPTWNLQGNLLSFQKPLVMGIVNVTPDSFYDGNPNQAIDQVLLKVNQMMQEGATFIDVGAYSSRPDASFVSEEEEIHRLLIYLPILIQSFPKAYFSIDTFRAKVAEVALNLGAHIINDISAGSLDDQMMAVVGKYQVPYIMMHMRGTPQTMQQLTQYEQVTKEVLAYFSDKIEQALQHQIHDFAIDPGFGFAKTLEQNFMIFQQLELFQTFAAPLLVGISRKSMIYKTLHTTPQEALNGTTALHMAALQKGANILRVHDVKPAMETISLYQKMTNS